MTGTGPAVILLRCDACGLVLSGLDSDRAWTCVPCGAAFEERGGRLVRLPYRALVLAPRPGPAGSVALPFWRVAFTAHVSGPNPVVRNALAAAAGAGRAWVRAFWMAGAFHVGDPGVHLTEASFDESLTDERLPACRGVRVASADAVRLARLFLLARADRTADISGADVVLDGVATTLVAVRFALHEGEIESPVDGTRWRRKTLPGVGPARS